jgi:hypothetical protein
MNEGMANNLKLDQPQKRTIWRKLRAFIWTIGIIAVLLAGLALWIEYRKFQETEFLTEIKNAGVRVHSNPAFYPWMRPYLSNNTRPFFEFISPLEYGADVMVGVANRDAIKKTLTLPNLVTLNLRNMRPLDDELVTSISQISSLRNLDLSRCKISDEGIDLLTKLPNLEQLKIDHVALSEKGLASLAKMNQLHSLMLGENGLDLLEGFDFGIKGANESKTIKVGDAVTFTGRFRSAKILPATVHVQCYQFTLDHNFSVSGTGTITPLKDETFQFVLKAPTKIKYPGYYRVHLIFMTAGAPRIMINMDSQLINVADDAKPPAAAAKPVDMGKIEGKVDLREGQNPKQSP